MWLAGGEKSMRLCHGVHQRTTLVEHSVQFVFDAMNLSRHHIKLILKHMNRKYA